MRKYGLVAVTVFVLAMPSLVAQTTATAPTPIPEEARRHFVIGATLFKDARTPDDYAQVESQFKQAVDLAPQWPDARYNLALSKEAAGDYSGAMADLKLYQQFKLSDEDARKVQDKVYVLEAKTVEATKAQAAAQQTAAAEEERKRAYRDKIGFLEGTWSAARTLPPRFGLPTSQFQAVITITGNNIFIRTTDGSQMLKGTIEGDDYSSIKWIYQQGPNPTFPLPDISINVTVDKIGHQIKWKTPGINAAGSGSWDWTYPVDVVLTQ